LDHFQKFRSHHKNSQTDEGHHGVRSNSSLNVTNEGSVDTEWWWKKKGIGIGVKIAEIEKTHLTCKFQTKEAGKATKPSKCVGGVKDERAKEDKGEEKADNCSREDGHIGNDSPQPITEGVATREDIAEENEGREDDLNDGNGEGFDESKSDFEEGIKDGDDDN